MVFVVAAIVFLLAFLLAIYDRRRALLVAVFLAPWQGLDVDVGLRLTGYLVVLIAILLVCILHQLLSRRTPVVRTNSVFPVLLVAYAVIWSAVQIPFLPSVGVLGGPLRAPELRAIAQIFMFILTISPMFLVPWAMRSIQDYGSMARIYVLSIVSLASIGWLQLAVWYTTGTDPLPIGFINSALGGIGEERSGIVDFQEALIFRMSSIGGEPKGLGAGIAVALVLLQLDPTLWRRKLIVWGFLFCSLIATLSTMAMLLWFVGTMIQFVAALLTGAIRPIGNIRLRLTSIVAATMVVSSITLALSTNSGAQLLDLLQQRTTGRIAESALDQDRLLSGVMEDFNIAVYDFLAHQPSHTALGVGLGNAHIHANSYLPEYAKAYADGTAFAAKSSVLRWISELGGLSLLAFLCWLIFLARQLDNAFGRTGLQVTGRHLIARGFVPMTVLWLASSYITPQFFLMIGALVGLAHAVHAGRKNNLRTPVDSRRFSAVVL